jgi:hypothetical protein
MAKRKNLLPTIHHSLYPLFSILLTIVLCNYECKEKKKIVATKFFWKKMH